MKDFQSRLTWKEILVVGVLPGMLAAALWIGAVLIMRHGRPYGVQYECPHVGNAYYCPER
jgi:hypothetical protein